MVEGFGDAFSSSLTCNPKIKNDSLAVAFNDTEKTWN